MGNNLLRRDIMIEIFISKDFSTTPGGRYIKEGPYSGEEFRENILYPKYLEATEAKKKLSVNLDGCFGFAPSFLEESFGGLARKLNNNKILNDIELVCNDEPGVVDRIKNYVSNALNKR